MSIANVVNCRSPAIYDIIHPIRGRGNISEDGREALEELEASR